MKNVGKGWCSLIPISSWCILLSQKIEFSGQFIIFFQFFRGEVIGKAGTGEEILYADLGKKKYIWEY